MHFSCTITFFIVPLHPISSRDGGIGRHEGLKILWPVMAVRVQVPLAVQMEEVLNMKMLGSFFISPCDIGRPSLLIFLKPMVCRSC